MNIDDIAIIGIDTIRAYDIGTGNFWFELDELQSAKIANTQDKTDITGKGGRKLSSLKKNKGVVVSGASGLVSGGLLEAQTGGTFATDANAMVNWADYLKINDNAAATTYKAVGTAGAEITAIKVKNANGTIATTLDQVASNLTTGKFTYDPGTKALAFFSGDYQNGTEIIVYYTRKISAEVLKNENDVYSKKCKMYIDTTGEDKCGNVYHIQFYIPKADFNGNFDFDMGENQTVHSFEAESLAGGCGASKTSWTYTIFGVNTEDAA